MHGRPSSAIFHELVSRRWFLGAVYRKPASFLWLSAFTLREIEGFSTAGFGCHGESSMAIRLAGDDGQDRLEDDERTIKSRRISSNSISRHWPPDETNFDLHPFTLHANCFTGLSWTNARS
jgi:hypothetical protein